MCKWQLNTTLNQPETGSSENERQIKWRMMSPYGSTNDHRQCTELERTAPPNPIGDGAAEEATNKSSSQANTHHKPCTQQKHNLLEYNIQVHKQTKTITISRRNTRYLQQACCRRSQGRWRCSPRARSPPCVITSTAQNEHEFQMRASEPSEAEKTWAGGHAPGVVSKEERGERGDTDMRQGHAPRRRRAAAATTTTTSTADVRHSHCGNGNGKMK